MYAVKTRHVSHAANVHFGAFGNLSAYGKLINKSSYITVSSMGSDKLGSLSLVILLNYTL